MPGVRIVRFQLGRGLYIVSPRVLEVLLGRLRYHDVVFEDGFLTAVRADGTVLRFTRRERTLLTALSGRPQRLLTRTHLYEALGSEGSDRAVDHAVNKLRAKLGDSGRDQRFISTQYGEGYVWVAPLAKGEAADGAFIVVQGGPSAHPDLLERLRGGRRMTYDFGGDVVSQVVFSSGGASFELDNIAVAVVPEPATWALLIAGFGLTGARLRKRRSAAAIAVR